MRIYFKKSILVWPLVIIFIFTSMSGIFAQQSPQPTLKKVDSEVMGLLNALGIILGETEEELHPESFVTRAELCAVAVKLLQKEDLPVTEGSVFKDVPNNYWAARYIKDLYSAGIISGEEDGFFKPENPCKYSIAVKAMVGILGLTGKAEDRGGYPFGYFSVASDAGITDGISLDNNDALTRGALAQMTFNTLNAPVPKQVTWGAEVQFTYDKDYIFMYHRFRIAKMKGILDGVGESHLKEGLFLQDDEVSINGTILKCNLPGIRDLMGMKLTAYVREDEDDSGLDEVIYAVVSSENEVTKITADQIVDEDDQFSETCIVWENEDNKIKKTKVSSSGLVLLNGYHFSGYTRNDFMISNGTLTLIDNDNDGTVEVVRIETGETLVVQYVDKSNNRILGKYPGTSGRSAISVDVENSDTDTEFRTAEGTLTTSDSIMEWDVVTLYPEPSGEVKRVVISATRVEGVVEEKGEDNHKQYITVEGNKYQLIDEYVAQGILSQPEVGDYGTLYLDAEGNVAAFKRSGGATQNRQYGYLVKCEQQKGISKKAMFKIFGMDGIMNTYISADNMKADETTCKTYEDLFNVIKDSNGSIQPQLVIYKLDSEGQVNYMDTIRTNSQNGETAKSNLSLLVDNIGGTALHYKNNGTFGAAYGLKSNTIVFQVPQDISKEQVFAIKKNGSFLVDNTYNFIGYGDPDYNMMDAMVLKLVGGDINMFSPIMLVDSITEAVMDSGEISGRITGYSDGKKVRLDMDPELYTRWKGYLHQGDVIRYAQGSINEITAIAKAIYYSDTLPEDLDRDPASNSSSAIESSLKLVTLYNGKDSANGITYGYFPVYGTAYAMSENKVVIEYGSTIPKQRLLVDTMSVKPFIWDKRKDKTYIGTAADVRTALLAGTNNASKVFVVCKSAAPIFMTIINE